MCDENYTYDSSYEKAINLLIEMKSEDLISNENFDHARSLIRLLVEKLEIDSYIGIFTGQLNIDGYGPKATIEAFKKRLDEGKKLKILFQLEPNGDMLGQNPFYQQILGNQGYRDKNLIETRVLLPAYSANDNHLLTVNNRAFRIETDHDHTKAIAGFNNSKGKGVRDYFEALFTDSFSKVIPV